MASRVKIAGCFTGFDPERPEGYPSGQRGQTVNLLSYDFGDSNPPRATKIVQQVYPSRRGSSSTVEPQPSKLMVRVRFPSPAPLDCNTQHKPRNTKSSTLT